MRTHSSEKLHSSKCCSPQNCSLEDSILAVLGSAEVPSVSLCTLKQPCVGGGCLDSLSNFSITDGGSV